MLHSWGLSAPAMRASPECFSWYYFYGGDKKNNCEEKLNNCEVMK